MYFLVYAIVLIHTVTSSSADGMSNGAGYSMYVWTTGFDKYIVGCDQTEFLHWNTKGHCFSHTWDTVAKRQWLWETCKVPGREISAIFLSGFHHILRDAYDTKSCNRHGVEMVRQTLAEGHKKVPGLQIYGLFAVNDTAVSEQYLVKYIVYYNDHCARSLIERLDGVATNNEAYSGIKCADDAKRTAYLDNLQNIVKEAGNQTHGKLLTHYSVSWNWAQCHGGKNMITWNGKTQDANHHMIDIFDSIDVQVAYIIYPQISDRLKLAAYEYAKQLGKKIYATFYTDKVSPCQISFFPQSCHVHGHSEAGLYKVIDSFAANGIDYAKPCIHYFRGVYSSGAHPDWPIHDGSSTGDVYLYFNATFRDKATHGMKARDKYGINKYLRTLEERLDFKDTVRNKQPSDVQESQHALDKAKRNFFLFGGSLERRSFGNFSDFGWLKNSCDNGCWWCCYVYKVITEQKPIKVKKNGKSSGD